MRTIDFYEPEGSIPAYVTLSHRWEVREDTHQDIKNGMPDVVSQKGVNKVPQYSNPEYRDIRRSFTRTMEISF